jgi:hypothetical protein
MEECQMTENNSINKKICFVISPIGEEGTNGRKRADNLLNHVIWPLIGDRYQVKRADNNPKPGIITTKLIEDILNSYFIIADLTDHNPNVIYELALAHAAGKPFIQIKDIKTSRPFDIQALDIIDFDITDLASVENLKKRINAQIKHIESGESIGSPITTVQQEKFFKNKGDYKQVEIIQILKKLENIESAIRDPRLRNMNNNILYPGAPFNEPRLPSQSYRSDPTSNYANFGNLCVGANADILPENTEFADINEPGEIIYRNK